MFECHIVHLNGVGYNEMDRNLPTVISFKRIYIWRSAANRKTVKHPKPKTLEAH